MSPEQSSATPPLRNEEEVPLIGVGRVEFHRGLDRLEHAGERQATTVLNTIGWTLVFIGGYIALGGWTMTKSKVPW